MRPRARLTPADAVRLPPDLNDPTEELRRIGVEAEADLAATLVNERREPIRELLQEISRP